MLRKVLVWLVVGASAWAPAEVIEAEDSLLSSQIIRATEAASEGLGFPGLPLDPGQSLSLLVARRASYSVTVIGPPGADAGRFARAVEQWLARERLRGDVRYSNEPEASLARFEISKSQFGRMTAEILVPVGSFVQMSRELGSETRIAMVAGRSFPLETGINPDYVSPAGAKYWDFTSANPREPVARAELTIHPWQVVLLALWSILLVSPTIALGAWAVRIGNRQDLIITERRRLLRTSINYGIAGSFGIPLLGSVALGRTGVLDPLGFLWFDQTFGSVATNAVVFVALACVLPMAGILTLQILKLDVLTPQETVKSMSLGYDPVPDPSPTKTRAIRQRWRVLIAGGFAGSGAVLLFSNSPLVQAIALALFSVPPLTYIFLEKSWKRADARDPGVINADSGFLSKVKSSAERVGPVVGLNVEPKLLDADDAAQSRAWGRRLVGVSRNAVNYLNERELDYLIAKEASHHVLGHVARHRRVSTIHVTALFAPIVVMAVTRRFELSAYLGIAMVAAALIWWAIDIRIGRREALAADDFAVQALGDPGSAISALAKTTLARDFAALHDTDLGSHPAIRARIERIRQSAESRSASS